MNLNKYIDHTLLKPEASAAMIEALCQEARDYDFMSVCINPSYVKLASDCLVGTDVKVCTVIGFPLGATTTETKLFELKQAISEGATELDMVINIGRLKMGDDAYVEHEIRVLKEATGSLVLKVILETCLLSDEEIVRACMLAKNVGADFVKTSTGFSSGGATIEAVALMRKTVGSAMGVKASGGVRSLEDMMAMIEAGASRIGTSSGVALIKHISADTDY